MCNQLILCRKTVVVIIIESLICDLGVDWVKNKI